MANKIGQGDLAAAIAADTGLTQTDVKKVLTSLTNTVTEHLTKGDTVQLTGFLTFERVQRAARTARNPQTGEAMAIPAGNAVKVSAGARLKNAIKAS